MKLTTTGYIQNIIVDLNRNDLEKIVETETSTVIELLKEKLLHSFKFDLKFRLQGQYDFIEIKKEKNKDFEVIGVNIHPHNDSRMEFKIELMVAEYNKLVEIFNVFESLKKMI